jgi:hypothetical protein
LFDYLKEHMAIVGGLAAAVAVIQVRYTLKVAHYSWLSMGLVTK